MYKLLIVEDEHLIRKWLHYAVDYESLGIIVIGEAHDGQEGAKLIREKKPDIVMTDINMPIMSAFDMFQATQKETYAKVILSGYADFENAREALRYGSLEFLTKPLEKTELMTCLQTIVSRLDETRQANRLKLETSFISLPQLSDQLPQAVLAIVDWIHEHYREKIVTSQMAHELGYSESSLYNLMKKHLNITINEYINQYRISLAIKLMLENPTMLVYEMAEEVGYVDYRYFERVFKKYVGVTVKQFKESKGLVVLEKAEAKHEGH